MSEQHLEKLRSLIAEKAAEALSLPGVLAVELGYRVRCNAITKESAVVVTVQTKIQPDQLTPHENLKAIFGADNVDVVQVTPIKALFTQPEKYGIDATTLDELEDRLGYPFVPGAVVVRLAELPAERLVRAKANITYRAPEGVALQPLGGTMRLRCHTSPDAGWKELRRFLDAVDRELTVGMFELTAPHVGDELVRQL